MKRWSETSAGARQRTVQADRDRDHQVPVRSGHGRRQGRRPDESDRTAASTARDNVRRWRLEWRQSDKCH